jgi:nucleotide-binding universal stress UspA family protein
MSFSSSPVLDQPPRPIVVGCDGSHWGLSALVWAAEHAWHTGAELDAWMWSGTSVPADVPRDGGLSHVTGRYPMLRVRTHESGADPVRDLEKAGRTAGLVVIGYRGYSTNALGLGGLVLPLVETATCDTVVVRGKPSALHGDNHRITALVSGGADDDLVVARAIAVARQHRSLLRVVHAVPIGDALASDHEFVLDHAARQLEKLDPRLSHTTVLLRFQPHEAITRCTDSDLIVVGSGDHHSLTGRCGTVTKAALHHAPCPVLVARLHTATVGSVGASSGAASRRTRTTTG